MYRFSVAKCCCDRCQILGAYNDTTEDDWDSHYSGTKPVFDSNGIHSIASTYNVNITYDKAIYADDNIGINTHLSGNIATLTYTFTFGSSSFTVEFSNYVEDSIAEKTLTASDNTFDRCQVFYNGTPLYDTLDLCYQSLPLDPLGNPMYSESSKVFLIRYEDFIHVFSGDNYLCEVPINNSIECNIGVSVSGTNYTLFDTSVSPATNGFITLWKPDKWWLFPENLQNTEATQAEINAGEKEREGCPYPSDCNLFPGVPRFNPPFYITATGLPAKYGNLVSTPIYAKYKDRTCKIVFQDIGPNVYQNGVGNSSCQYGSYYAGTGDYAGMYYVSDPTTVNCTYPLYSYTSLGDMTLSWTISNNVATLSLLVDSEIGTLTTTLPAYGLGIYLSQLDGLLFVADNGATFTVHVDYSNSEVTDMLTMAYYGPDVAIDNIVLQIWRGLVLKVPSDTCMDYSSWSYQKIEADEDALNHIVNCNDTDDYETIVLSSPGVTTCGVPELLQGPCTLESGDALTPSIVNYVSHFDMLEWMASTFKPVLNGYTCNFPSELIKDGLTLYTGGSPYSGDVYLPLDGITGGVPYTAYKVFKAVIQVNFAQ